MDLIKIDVEGFEFRALSGAQQLIHRHRPIITTEFSPAVLPKMSGCSGEEYLRFLIGLGYRLSVIADGATECEIETIMNRYHHLHHRHNYTHLDLLAMPTE